MPSVDLDQWDDENLFHPLLPAETDLFRESVVPIEIFVLPDLLENDLAPNCEWRNQSMWIVNRSCCSCNLSLGPLTFLNLCH